MEGLVVLSFWGKHPPTSAAFPTAVKKMDEGSFVACRFVMALQFFR